MRGAAIGVLAGLLMAWPAMGQNTAEAVYSAEGWTSPEGLSLSYDWSCEPECDSIEDGTTSRATMTFGAAGQYDICVGISDGVVTVPRCRRVLARLHDGPTGPDIDGPDEVILTPVAVVITGTRGSGATASDDTGVRRIQFLIDGTPLGNEIAVQSGPGEDVAVSLTWDSLAWPNGFYQMSAWAVDTAGNVGVAAPVLIEVRN